MKILYVATVRSHIGQFHMPVINALKAAGHTVHAAYKDNSADKPGLDLSIIDQVFEIPFERNPYSSKNIKSYKLLKTIIDNGNYDIIHCHTPVGGVITRLAAKDARKSGTKVFYTAHGFHFYKGASKAYWAVYYPIEKYLSAYTDTLITINDEDYNLALTKHFKATRVVKINGVGVDLTKYHVADHIERSKARNELGINDDIFVLLYAADLSKRKNQTMIFKALAELGEEERNLLVLMPGQPILKEQYEQECDELGISNLVSFMGYRRDIEKLLTACDCVISSSRQEGLPLNLIEAAASGKYIIATNVRGNSDVLNQYKFGELVQLDDSAAMAAAISARMKNRDDMSNYSKDRVNNFSDTGIVAEVLKLYQN